MPVDKLSGTFAIKNRAQIRDEWLSDFKLRIPDADVSKDSQPYVDGSCVADAVLPLYANSEVLADGTSFTTARGTQLDRWATAMKRPRRPAVGAVGYVVAETAAGGAEIEAETELRYAGRVRFKVSVTGVYETGDNIPVEGIDTGTATNITAGTVLQWVSPPPGVLGTCLVFENTDGSGLSGGAPEESDDELIDILLDKFQNPPSSGNTAAIISAVHDIKGLAIQKCFVFPCVPGPGEYTVAVLMRPAYAGASRAPNGAQLAKIEAELKGQFPGDDGIHVATISTHGVTPVIRVRWLSTDAGWADASPWPTYSSPTVKVKTGATPTVSSCRVENAASAPEVGRNIGFYDTASSTFKVKRINGVTSLGGGSYDLTFDLVAGVSDLGYVPVVGQVVSAWSPTANDLVPLVLAYMDAQGVGELYVSGDLLDPGVRRRRQPSPTPLAWPSTVGQAILDDIFELVEDATLAEPTTPYATTVGTPPAVVYVHSVSDLAILSQ